MKFHFKSYFTFNFEKMIALVYALVPFTQLYYVPGTGINLGFVSIFFCSIMFILLDYRKGSVIHYDTSTRFIGFPLWICMLLYCLSHALLLPPKEVYDNAAVSVIVILIQFLILLLCVLVFKNENVRDHYIRYIEYIAIFMSVVVFLQVLIYYGLGTSITVKRDFLLPFKAFFTKGVKESVFTSQMVIGGMFRPSAFFLEPAHFSQFCLIALAASLANEEGIYNKKAIIISLGTLLTTSGIGIASVLMLWGLKLFVNGEKISNKTIVRAVVGSILVVIVFIAFYSISSVFRQAITRITVASGGYNSAIEGRLGSRKLLKELDQTQFLFGNGFKNIPYYGITKIQYYMTGIVELIYCQGIVGTLLFATCYLIMLVRSYNKTTIAAFFILMLYIPYLIGSANLVVLSLIQYIPFLIVLRRGLSYSNYEIISQA